MELGIFTFAETALDPSSGTQLGAEERVQHLLDEIELADQVGLDLFGVGEHHRPDYVVSAPAIILAAAAAAARAKKIRLTSAVSVISSELFGTEVAPVVRKETSPSPSTRDLAPS